MHSQEVLLIYRHHEVEYIRRASCLSRFDKILLQSKQLDYVFAFTAYKQTIGLAAYKHSSNGLAEREHIRIKHLLNKHLSDKRIGLANSLYSSPIASSLKLKNLALKEGWYLLKKKRNNF